MKDEEIVDLVVKTSWAFARYIAEIRSVYVPPKRRKEAIDAYMDCWEQIYTGYMAESGADKEWQEKV